MYPLHKYVYEDNISEVSSLLNSDKDILSPNSLKDLHGNTPLHLSVSLGHKECTHLLLKHNHPIAVKNTLGWTPLQEAISYGDRQILTSLYKSLRKQGKQSIKKKRSELLSALDKLGGDFEMELHWDFQSWVPFVSRILPSDTCLIYRQGSKVRMDSTLEDFSDMRWVRGDISFIVDFSTEPEPEITLMDNKRMVYQRMKKVSQQEREASIEDEVDITMSSDIVDASIKTRDVILDRVQEGWIFKQDKCEKIGKFPADFYRLKGLTFQTRKRREHLSEEDIRKNRALRDAFSRGENTEQVLEEAEGGIEKRKSLPVPSKPEMTWDQYIKSPPGDYECLGRKTKVKTSMKTFEPLLGMSREFPVTLENLLPILEALGPKAKLFSKLRDFVTMKLPPGFPVRIDLPIFPTVKATVSFPQFQFRNDFDDDFFSVPKSYKEDPSWFDKSSKERQVERKKSKA
uniref:ankyrin repeat domain-containing protein 13C-like n=1 Tax=Styela clava TaxID=7725 RepID=UPI00193A7D3C|nr:ankyrin repeat domain-containing protein 13C-like [Styela clava]